MQTLLQAVLNRFSEWPAPGTDLHFSCDEDGEVRQRGEDDPGIRLDFYPEYPVRTEDRAVGYAIEPGEVYWTVTVKEDEFNRARKELMDLLK